MHGLHAKVAASSVGRGGWCCGGEINATKELLVEVADSKSGWVFLSPLWCFEVRCRPLDGPDQPGGLNHISRSSLVTRCGRTGLRACRCASKCERRWLTSGSTLQI